MTRLMSMVCTAALLGASAFLLGNGTANTLVSAAQAEEEKAYEVVEMTMGAEDAPVTIIEYASFTCPHCADFHNGPLKQIKKNYVDTGKVRLIYREVYFDRFGLWASMVARCGGPEKFFGITDLIYKSQSEWSRAGGPAEIVEELRKIGRLAGLEDEALEACLQDADMAQTLVGWYQANAKEHGIEGTPSFIVNGEKVSNQPYEAFSKLIDEKLGS